jgi:hypothetical protein
MKTAVVSILAVVIGSAIGWGLTAREFAHEQGPTAIAATSTTNAGGKAPVVGAPRKGEPRVTVVGSAEFNFGVMQKGETGHHTFILKNIGDAPATLKKGDTTCKCTLSELADSQLAPGETTEVALEWTPKEFADEFRQTAYIETPNDPQQQKLRLEIVGRVIQTVRAQPESIALSNISFNEARTAEVFVYCYRDKDFSLTVDRLADPSTAAFFDVQIVPLDPAEVAEEKSALAGAKVKVTVKPGLRLGPISQTIYLAPSSKDLPELPIAIQGSVTGDISVFAAKNLYNGERKIITIGAVDRAKGGTYKLQLLVKGPHAKDVKLSVGEVDPPDVLQVSIDTEHPSAINSGTVLMYPLTITIPPGSRPVSRLGGAADDAGAKLGKIVIETTHPNTKQLVLYVQFAVEG